MAPNVFIFQSVKDRYDLNKHLIEGETDIWHATRYRGDMKPGDIVFFWMAGDEDLKGMYGWGRLTSTPYIPRGRKAPGVDVFYDCRFTSRITRKELEADEDLARMLLFRAPQGTNFLLTPPEARKLFQLMSDRKEQVPVLEPVL